MHLKHGSTIYSTLERRYWMKPMIGDDMSSMKVLENDKEMKWEIAIDKVK